MQSTKQQIYAFRLQPGVDLKKELLAFAKENNLRAAYILSCVGSLQAAELRMAGADTIKKWEEKMEIVSLVGTLFKGGCHLHICLTDSFGLAVGGHLLDGCIVYTTAELVIGEAMELEFSREIDPQTGYLELSVEKRI